MNRLSTTINHSVTTSCIFSIAAILAFCAITGCVSDTTSSPSGTNGTAFSATDVVIPVDSPSSITYTSSMQKSGTPVGIMEGLVIKDRNGKFDPLLAGSWNVSSDAKTWTFHLAKNATWNDGVPFTCADVKFTNDYMKAYNLTLGYVLNDVQSIDCPDDNTAVVTLKTSYSGFLDQISRQPGITISPKHIWENVTDPQHYQDTRFVGTGPFEYVQTAPGYVQLKRNDNYYGKKANITGIVLKTITNADSQILALKNGEIDVVSGLTPAVAQSLAGEKNIAVYAINDTGAYEVAFNTAQYPANISAFRHAMSHAVDRDTISSIFGTGRPTETTFLIPSLAGDYVNPADVGMYDYNLTEAGEMLAAAGFVRNSQGTLIGPDGQPVTITMPLGSKGGNGNQKIVAVLKNDWAQLGITLTTLSYDDQTQYRKAVNQYPVFIDAFPVQLHDDPDALVNFAVTPTQDTNYYNFNNASYNTLVSEIRNTPNQTEITELGYRMQDILAQEVPTVPVASTDTLVAYRTDRFTGWDIGPGYHSITDPQVLLNLTPVQGE
ncbi:MAG: ABC transporter substrate-binding protein [Methanoregula sp.]|nr:ABC transporter substrate-binding protein [Methanoregula sp.]